MSAELAFIKATVSNQPFLYSTSNSVLSSVMFFANAPAAIASADIMDIFFILTIS